MNLSLILVVAGVTTLLFKYLKQPPVLGYLLAGFLTGPHFHLFPSVLESETITVWGEIGVVFLLFALGLEFNIKKMKKVGNTGATTAISEALIMMSVGFITGRLMGWNSMNALFLGGMLSISSTSIIIKAFDDMKLKARRFSQIVIGVLVFEDLLAILLLVLLSTIAVSNQFDGSDMIVEICKLLLFLILFFMAGIYIIPTLFNRMRKFMNEEMLLVVSLGMCLGMVVVASKSGFSPALGAFLMGMILSETDESEHILTLIQPVKNLFAAVFFISVGMLVDPVILVKYISPIVIITLIVLVVKPLAATLGVLLSGNSLRHSMQAGFCLSQIGEFSFIIATLGLSLKVIDAYVYPVIVSVSILTIFATPYIIKLAEPLYEMLYKSVPEGWRVVIREYGSGSRTLNHESDIRQLIRAYVSKVLIHSTWIITIIFIAFKFMIPLARDIFGKSLWVEIALCTLTLMAMAPFLYALMAKRGAKDVFDRLWADRKYARGPLLTLRLSKFVIGAMFINIVLGKFFSLKVVALVPVVMGIVMVISISRRLKNYYASMESHFLENLDKTKKHSGIAIPKRISNEIHIEYVDLMIYSNLVSMSIRDIHRQYHTGALIISIGRRDQHIDLPQNTEILQAGDRLLIVGNDQQIHNFKNCCESPLFYHTPNSEYIKNIDLYQFTIAPTSPLCGQKAHLSELVNSYGFLLVGYEREGQNFRRPRTEDTLMSGDTIWVVGERRTIKDIAL